MNPRLFLTDTPSAILTLSYEESTGSITGHDFFALYVGCGYAEAPVFVFEHGHAGAARHFATRNYRAVVRFDAQRSAFGARNAGFLQNFFAIRKFLVPG
mgnify:CR=1 FL=1